MDSKEYLLQDFGSFYLGGRKIILSDQPTKIVKRNENLQIELDFNGDYIIEPIYVQYFLPHQYRSTYVLIHGGGYTGVVWENTPDGRKGWLHMLLQNGIATYVVDTVERGRAGWCSIPNIWPEEPEMRSCQTAWIFSRLGEKFQDAYKNSQFPIEHFWEFATHNAPRWNCNATTSAIALKQLVEKIGNCTLIAHSQGADIAMQCLDLAPSLIKNIVLLEPAAFPQLSHTFKNDINVLILYGDNIATGSFWDNISKQAKTYDSYLKKIGINSKYISLPEQGIIGNSHMLMMDKNNESILNLILKQLDNL